jgi:hypothetical protein
MALRCLLIHMNGGRLALRVLSAFPADLIQADDPEPADPAR